MGWQLVFDSSWFGKLRTARYGPCTLLDVFSSYFELASKVGSVATTWLHVMPEEA